MDAVFSISLPRKAYTVAVARDILDTFLYHAGLCRHCINDILLAASEAFTNAVEHGEAAQEYKVDVEIGPYWCELRISHTGRTTENMVLAELLSTDHVPLPDLESESGRGIVLMQCLMDEVAFEEEPRTTVLLRKRLAPCKEAHAAAFSGVSTMGYALL